jgi:hypothetical protein
VKFKKDGKKVSIVNEHEFMKIDPNYVAEMLGAEYRGQVPSKGGFMGALQALANTKRKFYRVVMPHYVCGFFLNLDGYIGECAPIMSWAKGKTLEKWVTSKKGTVTFLSIDV